MIDLSLDNKQLDLTPLQNIAGVVKDKLEKKELFESKFAEARKRAENPKTTGEEFINWGTEAYHTLGKENVPYYDSIKPLPPNFTGWVFQRKDWVSNTNLNSPNMGHFENESDYAYIENGQIIYEQLTTSTYPTEKVQVRWHTPNSLVTETYFGSIPNTPTFSKSKKEPVS